MTYDLIFRVSNGFEYHHGWIEIEGMVFATDSSKVEKGTYGVVLTVGDDYGTVEDIQGKEWFPDLFELKRENFEKLAETGFIEILP